MAELEPDARARLRDSSFAYIDHAGERHLSIHDSAHVRNAVARFEGTDFESKSARYAAARPILAAARRHDIDVDRDSAVARGRPLLADRLARSGHAGASGHAGVALTPEPLPRG